MNSISLNNSDYNSLSYAETLPQQESFSSISKKVALAALPFLSLYKPFSFGMTLGSETLKSAASIASFYSVIQGGNGDEMLKGFVKTALQVSSCVLTLLAHPIGVFISAGQEIVKESVACVGYLKERKYAKASESGALILNSALYISVFVIGGLEISIASTGMQILLGAYQSQKEYREGRWLEGTSHLIMSGYRMKGVFDQFQLLRIQTAYFNVIKLEIEKFQKLQEQESFFPENFDKDKTDSLLDIQTHLRNLEFEELDEKYRETAYAPLINVCKTFFGKIQEFVNLGGDIVGQLQIFLSNNPSIVNFLDSFFEKDRLAVKSFIIHSLPSQNLSMHETLASRLALFITPFSSVEEDETIRYWTKKRFDEVPQDQIQYALLAYLESGDAKKVEEANLYILSLEARINPFGKVSGIMSLLKNLVYYGKYDDFSATIYTTILHRCEDKLTEETKAHLCKHILMLDGGEFSNKTPYIPFLGETENHILMINSSRYLKNKWLLDRGFLDPQFDNQQNGLEEKLLDKLRQIRANGLDEYNSIPYVGYSMTALLNLYEHGSYAVQRESKFILDDIAERFAYRSLDMKCFSPFRRQSVRGDLTSLYRSYETKFFAKWLKKEEFPDELQKLTKDRLCLVPACSSYKLSNKTRDLLLNKETQLEYFAKISHSSTSIGGSPELYYKGRAEGGRYVLSAGGAYSTGIYRKAREIVTGPTTLILEDGKTDLKDCFYLGGESAAYTPSEDAYSRNNTGVYRNFACGACAVHVPAQAEVMVASSDNKWKLFKGIDGLFIAVYSEENLGIMALFSQKDCDPNNLLQSIIEKNSSENLLANSFTFPDDRTLSYDVKASQNEWVMKSETFANGEKIAFERDFAKWDSFVATTYPVYTRHS